MGGFHSPAGPAAAARPAQPPALGGAAGRRRHKNPGDAERGPRLTGRAGALCDGDGPLVGAVEGDVKDLRAQSGRECGLREQRLHGAHAARHDGQGQAGAGMAYSWPAWGRKTGRRLPQLWRSQSCRRGAGWCRGCACCSSAAGLRGVRAAGERVGDINQARPCLPSLGARQPH